MPTTKKKSTKSKQINKKPDLDSKPKSNKVISKSSKDSSKDDTSKAIMEVIDILTSGHNKKFNQVRLFQILKIRGVYKNSNDLQVKLQDLEDKKELFHNGGAIWSRA